MQPLDSVQSIYISSSLNYFALGRHIICIVFAELERSRKNCWSKLSNSTNVQELEAALAENIVFFLLYETYVIKNKQNKRVLGSLFRLERCNFFLHRLIGFNTSETNCYTGVSVKYLKCNWKSTDLFFILRLLCWGGGVARASHPNFIMIMELQTCS